MIRHVLIPALLAGLIIGLAIGYTLGMAETRRVVPEMRAMTDSLAFEVDVLHGRTTAGLDMCRDALNARRN